MSRWPVVSFGEVLTPNRRPYTLAPDEDANLVGMRLYGLGPFHRELKPADRIRKKTHFVIRRGDVIYNKLFAWKGTFGIVPPELDGMFVSDKFPTYELDDSRLDSDYLRWCFRLPSLWEQARQMSTGSAALSKLTLNPPRFLDLTMPLPPIEEQRRVVRRVEQLAAAVARLCRLQADRSKTLRRLLLAGLGSLVATVQEGGSEASLGELVDPHRGISYGIIKTGTPTPGGVPTVRAGDMRPFLVRSFGLMEVDRSIEAEYSRTRLRGGELLLRIRGGLGDVAVCPAALADANVAREIAVIPIAGSVLPEYVMYVLATPRSQDYLLSHRRGTSYQGVNLRDVRTLMIPVPPAASQQRLVDEARWLRGRINACDSWMRDQQLGIDALLQSAMATLMNR